MKIIISPAKKMVLNSDVFDVCEPLFVCEAEKILCVLRSKSKEGLQKIWKCNDSLADLNFQRLDVMDLKRNLTPAILAYKGLQYKHMSPLVFSQTALEYASRHLRILSGFYGILRPFDGVVSYRLEMQAKLAIENKSDLYKFWGDKIAKNLEGESDYILNLASKEYAKAVKPHISKKTRFVTCLFMQEKGGKLVEMGTQCKMARGEMVRFLCENNIENENQIKEFNSLGYEFSLENSNSENLVFIRR